MFSGSQGPGESDSVTNISPPPCPRHVTPFDEFYAENRFWFHFELFQLQGQQNSANPRRKCLGLFLNVLDVCFVPF